MSGVFPEAADLSAFYQNLKSGRDSIRFPARERLVYSGASIFEKYKQIGHLGRIDLFDPVYFGLSKGEADEMSPRQRILLQLL